MTADLTKEYDPIFLNVKMNSFSKYKRFRSYGGVSIRFEQKEI